MQKWRVYLPNPTKKRQKWDKKIILDLMPKIPAMHLESREDKIYSLSSEQVVFEFELEDDMKWLMNSPLERPSIFTIRVEFSKNGVVKDRIMLVPEKVQNG